MRGPERIVRLNTVEARTGLSKSTIYRKMRDGTFPPKLTISANGTGWHESDIDRWVENPAGWRADNDNAAGGGKAVNRDAG